MTHKKSTFGKVLKVLDQKEKNVANTATKAVSSVYHSESKLMSEPFDIAKGLTSNSLFLPALIVGGIAVIYVINSKK
jgi:hypothetical protein